MPSFRTTRFAMEFAAARQAAGKKSEFVVSMVGISTRGRRTSQRREAFTAPT